MEVSNYVLNSKDKFITESFLPSDIAAAYLLEGLYTNNYSPQPLISFLKLDLSLDLSNIVKYIKINRFF